MFHAAAPAITNRRIAHEPIRRRLHIDIGAKVDSLLAFDPRALVGHVEAFCADGLRLASGLPGNLDDTVKRPSLAISDISGMLHAHSFASLLIGLLIRLLIRMSRLHCPEEQLYGAVQVGPTDSQRLLLISLHSPDNPAHVSRVARSQIAATFQAELTKMHAGALFTSHFETGQHAPEYLIENFGGNRVHQYLIRNPAQESFVRQFAWRQVGGEDNHDLEGYL